MAIASNATRNAEGIYTRERKRFVGDGGVIGRQSGQRTTGNKEDEEAAAFTAESASPLIILYST